MTRPYDLLVKNVRVVRPNKNTVELLDVGIKGGKFAALTRGIRPEDANEVIDGKNLLGFPGCVDAHMHIGIYRDLAQDAVSESKAAAMGGTTTSLTYFRTGQYYLNRGGPYRRFMPEVLRLSEGNYWVDYGYHLAPIEAGHIDEMESLLTDWGVPSFKIFMFYGGYGLHGRSSSQNEFLMIGPEERYDIAHFEFIMRSARRLMLAHPEIAARPPHAEGLAIWIASYLAYETECLNINLLHLSSKKAIDAALMMQKIFPHIHFRREVTVGHLLLDTDCACGVLAKVNPPIRPRADVEALWEAVLERKIDWIVSDHACCATEQKYSAQFPKNIWLAKSGFGGTEYLLSGVLSEGRKRGMGYNHVAEVLSWNPARRYGLLAKGDIAPGFDADLVLVDPDESFVVRAAHSESAQGYTPFEGQELTGRVKTTFLRGRPVYRDGNIVGAPGGIYLRRPAK